MQISPLQLRYSTLWTLSSILFIQLLFYGVTFSSPTSVDFQPAANGFQSRQPIAPLHEKRANVPSTQKLIQMGEKSRCMEGKVSIFFTGFPNGPGYSNALKWAREKLGSRGRVAMYDNCIPSSDYQLLNSASGPDDMKTPEQDRQFIINLSKAFAWGTTSEIAYLIIPDAMRSPDAKSVWQTIEAPLLTRNPHVKQIVRVGYPSKKEEQIWKTGDSAIGGSPTL